MFLNLFRFIFEINFFVFPISAGILAYKKINGKPAGRFLRMMIMSFIMLLVSFIGVILNETVEHRQQMINHVKQSMSDFVTEKNE